MVNSSYKKYIEAAAIEVFQRVVNEYENNGQFQSTRRVVVSVGYNIDNRCDDNTLRLD